MINNNSYHERNKKMFKENARNRYYSKNGKRK